MKLSVFSSNEYIESLESIAQVLNDEDRIIQLNSPTTSPASLHRQLIHKFSEKAFAHVKYFNSYIGSEYFFDGPVVNADADITRTLLTEETQQIRILSGALGIGKTALMRQLCHRWASLPEDKSPYDWVFILDLKTIPHELVEPNPASDIGLLFMDWLLSQSFSADYPKLSMLEKLQFMRHLYECDQQQRVLFIIDGWNEWPYKQINLFACLNNNTSSVFHLLLSGPCIITSRTQQAQSLARFLNSSTSPYRSRVQTYSMTGFTDDLQSKEVYLCKSDMSPMVKQRLFNLLDQEPLKSLSDSPYLFYEICKFYSLYHTYTNRDINLAHLINDIVKSSLMREIKKSPIAFGFTGSVIRADQRVQDILFRLSHHGYWSFVYESEDLQPDSHLFGDITSIKINNPLYLQFYFSEYIAFELEAMPFATSNVIKVFTEKYLIDIDGRIKHADLIFCVVDNLIYHISNLVNDSNQVKRDNYVACLNHIFTILTTQECRLIDNVKSKHLLLLLLKLGNLYLRAINQSVLSTTEIFVDLEAALLEPFLKECLNRSRGIESDNSDLESAYEDDDLRLLTNYWLMPSLQQTIYMNVGGDTLLPYLRLLVWMGEAITLFRPATANAWNTNHSFLYRLIQYTITICDDSIQRESCELLFDKLKPMLSIERSIVPGIWSSDRHRIFHVHSKKSRCGDRLDSGAGVAFKR